ncbi:hypothetical protein [Amycolatopsis thermophila]|uniref:Uncharacterized protein n=1 Tax=Amycolatopsis thermophila TaxID=206084 RepID=A0ABU0EML4_9PSEU|nr:hypothetical protein [Amycolatopsis thermophila]MDQ0376520.1 hypothetical protein [Amycolatopsis thermophila]
MTNPQQPTHPEDTTAESPLVQHAIRELDLIGEEDPMRGHLLDLIRVFAGGGHSGFSAEHTVEVFSTLARFQPLSPLTTDPAEWFEHDEAVAGQPGLYQSRRNPAAFSTDGGKTYTLTDDPTRTLRFSVDKAVAQ